MKRKIRIVEEAQEVEVEGLAAAIIQAVAEFQSRLVAQQGKLKLEIDVAGEGDEVRIKPMPVYVYRRQ